MLKFVTVVTVAITALAISTDQLRRVTTKLAMGYNHG